MSKVLHNPDLIQPQDLTGPLQKDSLDPLRAPGLGLNGSQADRETASMSSERAVTSWDDMIPLFCQKGSGRLRRPGFRHPPGTLCTTGILSKPTAGETAHE